MSFNHGIYMSIGHIEYASLNGTHIFKIVGEVRAHGCISLDKLLNRMDQSEQVVGAIVDLTETTFIDSTVLGILAKLGLKLMSNQAKLLLLLNCKNWFIMRKLGFLRFLLALYLMIHLKLGSTALL